MPSGNKVPSAVVNFPEIIIENPLTLCLFSYRLSGHFCIRNVKILISSVSRHDIRLLCIDITLGSSSICFINCYLPDDDSANIDVYIEY